MTVGDVCGRSIVTAHPDDTVLEAARRMRDRHVGDVVVADSESRPVGILTDRDIVVSALAQSPEKLEGLVVGDIMTRNVVTAKRAESLHEALTRMRAHGIRRLPVVNTDGRLDGMLAFDDIIGVMSADLNRLAGLVAHEQTLERTVRK
jgi:CBS domain-containing protein